MRLRLLQSVVLLLAASSVLTAGGFSKLPASARAVSLGGTLVTLSDDPNVIFSNPAGIAALGSLSLSTSYSQLYPGITDDNLRMVSASAVANLGFVGNLGVGLRSFSASAWREQEFTACYAQEFFEGFSIGGSMKFLHWSTPDIIGQTNEDEVGLSKFTASFEVGIQTQIQNIFPDNDLRFGLSLGDFTRPNIAVSDSLASPLDTKLVAGGSYISRVYNYSITIHYTSVGELKHWGIGAEVNVLKATVADLPAEIVLRVGGNGLTRFSAFQDGALRLKLNTAEETLAGGFGIRLSGLDLDYAYGSTSELMNAGGTHHLSLRYSF